MIMTDEWPKVKQGRPPIYGERMRDIVQAPLPADMARQLRAEAKRAGVDQAQVVRWALEEYLALVKNSQARVKETVNYS